MNPRSVERVVTQSLIDFVGVGVGIGAGVGIGVGAGVGVGVGVGFFRTTPLFQTNFFPDLMHV
jgi:hypothetical protein